MPVNSEFHAMKAEEAVKALESSLQGLSEEEAERRLEEFGFSLHLVWDLWYCQRFS